MSFRYISPERISEVGRLWTNHEYITKIYEFALGKKFSRFEFACFTSDSDVFCLSWIEVVGGDQYYRTAEHWDAKVMYEALEKMYGEDNFSTMALNIALEETHISAYGAKKKSPAGTQSDSVEAVIEPELDSVFPSICEDVEEEDDDDDLDDLL